MTTFKIPMIKASKATVANGRIFFLLKTEKIRSHRHTMTDLDEWRAKPTFELLADAQAIVDKYKDAMQDADYVALCNANRCRFARETTTQSPESVDSVLAQVQGDRETMEGRYRIRLVQLKRMLENLKKEMRLIPRRVVRATPTFKKRAVRTVAEDMGIQDRVKTYHDLKTLYPEMRDEVDFYTTLIPILNRRWFLLREDVRCKMGAIRFAIRQVENRMVPRGYIPLD